MVYVVDEKTTQLFRDYFINHGHKDPGTLNNQYNGGFLESLKTHKDPYYTWRIIPVSK